MVDLLEVHVDELEWLWRQRDAALRSMEYDFHALVQLDERIAAHVDALVLAAEEARALLRSRLVEAEDAYAAFGAAHALLLQEDTAVPLQTLELSVGLDGSAWEGFRLALRYAPPERYVDALKGLVASGSERHAAAALEVLAFHGHAQPDAGVRLLELLDAAQPGIRSAAWGIVSLVSLQWLEASGQALFRRKLAQRFPIALADSSSEVRASAWWAAAWTRQSWLLSGLRMLAKAPESPDHVPGLKLLAVLGAEADLSLFKEALGRRELGSERFLLAGTFGHPGLMEEVLRAMESGGPEIGAAAASAFRKLTGLDVNTIHRVAVLPTEALEEEEVHIPDAVAARNHWGRLKAALSGVSRICMGTDVLKGWTQEWLRGLPLEARWEHALRARFETGRGESVFACERFPQRRE
ncbi:hypothetical protein MYSTI_07756 [Myxococcus stipitatus DSM 14675]|uniref:Uncharacterized protein n=2 Tax=Myxococcus stipitatus TaxID=83455 RepID=L7ULY5_MYXSD|nr:hypothetical protein MYSTI_07756 [Myxococcus stipitatus DSM 14675]